MYKNSIKVMALGTGTLSLFRILEKLLFIDIDSGFFNGPKIFEVFGLLLFFSFLLFFSVLTLKQKDKGINRQAGNQLLEITGFVLSGYIFFLTIVQIYLTISKQSTGVNTISIPLRILEYILGIGAAFSLLAFSSSSEGGEKAKRNGILTLSISSWVCFYMLDRFITFRQVRTASDQLMETFFILFSILFWIEFSKSLEGYKTSRKKNILFGQIAIFVGMPLVLGQILSIVVYSKVSGPTALYLGFIIISSIYMSTFIESLNDNKDEKVEKAEE